MRRLLLFLSLLIVTSTSAATDVLWQSSGGTLSGSWNDAARWSGGNVPDTTAENAVISAGSASPYIVVLNGAMYPAGLDVNKVFVGSPSATLTISGLALRTSEPGYGVRGYGNSARMTIDGGSVTTSGIQLSHGTTAQPVQVTLTGVQLDAGTLWLSEGSRLGIGGAGSGSVPGTSWLLSSSQLDLAGGTVTFGDLKIGGSVWEQKTACRIQGAAVTAASVQMNLTGSALYTAPLLEVTSGSLTANYAIIGAKNNNLASDAYLVRVNGGALTFSGTVSLGVGDYARATLEINGGHFTAQHLNVGSMDAQGRYLQNNGTSTITGTLTLYTQTYDINGTRQFVAGRGSTLRLTGSGFAKFGSSGWLPELLSTLDLSGVIAFEPVAGVTEQQLLAFSEDRGTAATAADNNYAIGMLDVTQLVAGGRRLRVTAAGNYANAAVYVRALRGFPAGTTAATVANALTGTNVKVYYDPANSPNLTGTYAFGTNSQLIPLAPPVLPTITLQSLGTAVHAARITAMSVTPKANGPGQHWAVVHYANDFGDAAFGWYRVDLNGSDHAALTPSPLVRGNAFNGFYPDGQLWAENGRLFYIMGNAGGLLHMQYFDPVTAQIHELADAALPEGDSGYYVFTNAIVGRDKRIYAAAGSSSSALVGKVGIVVINPDTLQVTKLLDVAPPDHPRALKLTYPRYLAANPPWVYVSIGQGQWDLVAVNIHTGVKNQLLHIDAEADGFLQVVDGTYVAPRVESILFRRPFSEIQSAGALPYGNGSDQWYSGHVFWYADGSGTYTRKEFYWCMNGQVYADRYPFTTTDGDTLPSPVPAYPSETIPFTQTQQVSWPEASRPEIDKSGAEKAVRNAQGQWTHTIRSRPKGSSTWTSSTYSVDAVVRPVPITRLLPLSDGTLFGYSSTYQGFFRHRPGVTPIEHYGADGSSRALMFQNIDGKVMICGYPSTTLFQFDPAAEYTAVHADWFTTNPAHNPFRLGAWSPATIAGTHYPQALIPDGRGRTYMTGRGERDNYNSAVGYYDSLDTTQPFKGRVTAPMQHLQPTAILYRAGATAGADRLIFSGHVFDNPLLSEAPPPETRLRVFDRELNELTAWQVKPGLLGTGELYAGAASQGEELIGSIMNAAWIPAAQQGTLGSYALYRFNAVTGQTVDWKPQAQELSALMKKTPDDGWYYAIQYDAAAGRHLLVKIHPEDLSIVPVAKFPAGVAPSPMVWFDGAWHGAIDDVLYRLSTP